MPKILGFFSNSGFAAVLAGAAGFTPAGAGAGFFPVGLGACGDKEGRITSRQSRRRVDNVGSRQAWASLPPLHRPPCIIFSAVAYCRTLKSRPGTREDTPPR